MPDTTVDAPADSTDVNALLDSIPAPRDGEGPAAEALPDAMTDVPAGSPEAPPAAARLRLAELGAGRSLPGGAAALANSLSETAERAGLKVALSTGRALRYTASGTRRTSGDTVRPGSTATWSGSWTELSCTAAGTAALLLDDPLTCALADLLLGGPGESEDRPPVAMEVALVRRHMMGALPSFAAALTAAGLIGATLDAADPGERSVAAAMGRRELLALDVEVAVSGRPLGTFTLAIPAGALLSDRPGTDLRAALPDVPLELTVRFLPTRVNAADLSGLAPGDVLRLDTAAIEAMAERPSGRGVLRGELGRRGTLRAVTVHTLLEHR